MVENDQYKQILLKGSWEKFSIIFLKCGVRVQSMQNTTKALDLKLFGQVCNVW